MMLIQTSERCPECDALIYLKAYAKKNNDGQIIDTNDCIIADGIYLDWDGVLCITQYDENTKQPDYYCMLCRWIA